MDHRSHDPCLNLHHTRHPKKRDKELDGSPAPKSMFLGFGVGEGGGGGVADGEIFFSTSHVTQHGQASKTALNVSWLGGFLVRKWRTRSRSSWGSPAAALFLSGLTGLRAVLMGSQIEPCGSLTDSTQGHRHWCCWLRG